MSRSPWRWRSAIGRGGPFSGEGNMMDMRRLARESQILVAAAALITVGLLREQLSLLVVFVAVVGSLYLAWNGVTGAARER
jgi:arginine exporter protein ArgO